MKPQTKIHNASLTFCFFEKKKDVFLMFEYSFVCKTPDMVSHLVPVRSLRLRSLILLWF